MASITTVRGPYRLWWSKPEILIYLGYLVIYEQFKFHAQLSWAWEKFYNLMARGLEIDPWLLQFFDVT